MIETFMNLPFENLLTGIVVTVIGGVILFFILPKSLKDKIIIKETKNKTTFKNSNISGNVHTGDVNNY